MYAGSPLDLEALYKRLVKAEEAGLIIRQTVNDHDEPIQTWKSNMINYKNKAHPEM